MIEQDQAVADEAERVAKALEAAEALEIARLEREAELNKKKQASAENDWVQRSR